MIETFSLTNAAIGNHEDILHDIHDNDKSIAIYERDIHGLQADIKILMQDSFEYRAHGGSDEISGALDKDFASYFSDSSRLIKDLKKQIELFYQVTRSSSFNLLLATVTSDMCRRFHTDMNDLRMLCTYSGPGTLWLTEDNINKDALYSKEGDKPIAIDENGIQQAPSGAVIILKGGLYPKAGSKAILHRSPSVEESAQKRLLLRIDTNDSLGALMR